MNPLMGLLALIAVLAIIIWKTVTKPSVTIAPDSTTYPQGANATFTGQVTTTGDPSSVEVTVVVTPPVGDSVLVGTMFPDIAGNYSIAWLIPSDAEGVYTVEAAITGDTASATFTQIEDCYV